MCFLCPFGFCLGLGFGTPEFSEERTYGAKLAECVFFYAFESDALVTVHATEGVIVVVAVR